MPTVLTGRTVLYTDAVEINSANIVQILSDVSFLNQKNCSDINYLYRYYKGDQPILERTKEINKGICNKVVVNRANEIVSFKTGYLVGEPIQYVSRKTSTLGKTDQISLLNDYMILDGKASKDEELADWQHICGTAYRIVLPSFSWDDDGAPFTTEVLDPRSTFVVYSTDIGHRPMLAGCYVKDEEGRIVYTVYTEKYCFRVIDCEKLDKVEENVLGKIPIIEYPANEARLGAFEIVLPALDLINNITSNRADGIEQFIQALLILTNCHLPDEITADKIKELGLIELQSNADRPAKVDMLASQLDQTQTQMYIDDIYQAVLSIVGMPSQGNGKTSDSSNNGAVIMRNGWQTAEARAKRSEIMWKRSEAEALKLVLKICRVMRDEIDLRVSDIEIKFTRRNYEDIGTKSTVLISLLNNPHVAAIDAFTVCGMFSDPEEACKRGEERYAAEIQAQLDAISEENKSVEENGGDSVVEV